MRFWTAHNTNLHYKHLSILYNMPLASKAKGPLGSSQRSGSCASSRVDDAMPDAPTQPDTASTTPIESKLSTILLDYERIDTYLTEIGAPDEIVDALDRITCLAQHAEKSPPAGPPEKRRKGPGRPLGSTKAAKNTKDIQGVFNRLYKG